MHRVLWAVTHESKKQRERAVDDIKELNVSGYLRKIRTGPEQGVIVSGIKLRDVASLQGWVLLRAAVQVGCCARARSLPRPRARRKFCAVCAWVARCSVCVCV